MIGKIISAAAVPETESVKTESRKTGGDEKKHDVEVLTSYLRLTMPCHKTIFLSCRFLE